MSDNFQIIKSSRKINCIKSDQTSKYSVTVSVFIIIASCSEPMRLITEKISLLITLTSSDLI
jgi:hypothetical protein